MRIKDRARPSLPPVAPGTYGAVCVYSIDLGEQPCKYKDKAEVWNNQVQLGFELAGQTVEIDGKQEPRVLSRTFNVTRSKNGGLRKFVEAWQGVKFSDENFAEFDPNSLVGQAAFISVVLNETGEYANIDSAMGIPAGYPIPQAASPMFVFDMEPWDQAAFDALPEWAQAKIRRSTQYQRDHAPTEAVSTEGPGPAAVPPQAGEPRPAVYVQAAPPAARSGAAAQAAPRVIGFAAGPSAGPPVSAGGAATEEVCPF